MNKLRIAHNLSLHDRHRVIYSILEVNNLRLKDEKNLSTIRALRSFGKSSEYSVSVNYNKNIRQNGIIPSQAVPTKVLQSVALRINKITPFCMSNTNRMYGGLFCQQNFIPLSTDHHGSFNYTNVRRFSDESTKNIVAPKYMQLDGVWKTLSESAAVENAQNALIWLHSTTGLPWWATIILATCSIRALVTLPLAIHQHYILAKFHNIKGELTEIVKELKYETNVAVYKFKWTEDEARAAYNYSLHKQRKMLIERENCHPLKSIVLVLIQIPMWITLSTALRNMCYMLPSRSESAHELYLEFATGGFGSIINLTIPDGTFVLPITLGIINLTIVEIQYMMRVSEPIKIQKIITNLARFISIIMVPVAMQVPAAVSLYWVSSSAFGIFQNFLLMSPKFRRLMRIPKTDVELQEPYKHLSRNVMRRIGYKNDPTSEQGKLVVDIKKIATKSDCKIKHESR